MLPPRIAAQPRAVIVTGGQRFAFHAVVRPVAVPVFDLDVRSHDGALR
jgi:hypothetical protein